jgi:MFS family permease
LTKSPAAVGLISGVEFVPLVLGAIVGGPLIDRYDRRRLLLVTQLGIACTSGVLLWSSLVDNPPLWILYVAAGVGAAIGGIDHPTSTAIEPNLVRKELIPGVVALKTVMWSVSAIIGPAIGGVIVGVAGLPWAYGLDLASFLIAIVLVFRLPAMPADTPADKEGPVAWEAIKEGLRYLKGRRVLQSTFSIDLVAMIFGLPASVFTFLAVEQFHRGAAVVGLLLSAMALGGLIAGLATGWVDRVRHQGQAVVWAVVVWGAGIAAFGLVGNHLAIALVLLAIAGGADTISAVFRSTILQASVPDELRGRLSSLHFLVVAGGPRLGNFEAGIVAEIFSPTVAVVSGGLLCIAGAVLNAVLVPEFWRFHAGGKT